MIIKIESTTKIVELNGVPARIWEGITTSGVPVHCYVTRIAVDPRAVNSHGSKFDLSSFEKELRECRAPSPEVEAIPLRMIL